MAADEPGVIPLDDREQRYSLWAACLGAATCIALWAPAFDETAGILLAAIGVAMAALLALAARRRSRLLTGLAAMLLAFGPWGMAWILGLPYLALAAWLAWRAPKLAAAAGWGPARRERKERTPRAGRRRYVNDVPDQAPAPPPRRSGPPPANKRYTPPQRRS